MFYRAKKKFGQNFLCDAAIIDYIINLFNPQKTDKIIEIGPGLGALTQPLLMHVDSLTAIEIDKELANFLMTVPNARPKLNLINTDALSIDYGQWQIPIRIIGNLPYNIATTLILKLLNYKNIILDMHFMVQLEVAERLIAAPGSRDYGRLSIITQYYFNIELLRVVPPHVFTPQPQVDSAIIKFSPYNSFPFDSVDPAGLQNITREAFKMRRKTLLNNLKNIINQKELVNLGIDCQQRPEKITIEQYIKIANFLATKNTMY